MKLLTELLTLSEDWGSSDWKPVMDAIDNFINTQFDGKRSKENIKAAAEELMPRWHEAIGFDDEEDTVHAMVRTYLLRRKDTIVEAKGKGSEWFTIHNMNGTPKKFKQIDGFWENPKEARAWMKSTELPRTAKAFPKPIREPREKKPVIDLQQVYNKTIEVIGNIFPDGDPIDHLIRPISRMGVPEYEVMELIDKAMKKHGDGVEKKGMYAYMAAMWDDMANDALYDAKNGHAAREPFVQIKNDKPVKLPNPWKTTESTNMKLKEVIIDMKTRKEVKPKEITMLQAFGSEEMNVLHDAGIKLAEKPSEWSDFEDGGYLEKKYVHPMFSITRAEKKLGGKFKVYTGNELYGIQKPKGPQVSVKQMPEEHMFIVDFGDSKYLADRTGARTYIRNWAKISK